MAANDTSTPRGNSPAASASTPAAVAVAATTTLATTVPSEGIAVSSQAIHMRTSSAEAIYNSAIAVSPCYRPEPVLRMDGRPLEGSTSATHKVYSTIGRFNAAESDNEADEADDNEHQPAREEQAETGARQARARRFFRRLLGRR